MIWSCLRPQRKTCVCVKPSKRKVRKSNLCFCFFKSIISVLRRTIKGLQSTFLLMGLNAINLNSYAQWENGANITYNGWQVGEPSQWNKGERCIMYLCVKSSASGQCFNVFLKGTLYGTIWCVVLRWDIYAKSRQSQEIDVNLLVEQNIYALEKNKQIWIDYWCVFLYINLIYQIDGK